MTTTIAVIPGDGIGPEIMQATLRVIDALGLDLKYDFVEAGLAAAGRSAVTVGLKRPSVITVRCSRVICSVRITFVSEPCHQRNFS